MIDANGVVFAAPGATRPDEVTLHVAAREHVGIAVEAGNRGSLLLRVLAGLVRPASGTVMIDGIDLLADPLRARERLVYAGAAAVPAVPLRASEWIRGVTAARGVDARPRLQAVFDTLELPANTSVDRLRGTERGLVSLALAVALRPRVVLLDAPLGGMDSRRRSELMARALEELADSTIALTSNDLSELALCHRRMRLTDGRLEPGSGERMRCAG